jgi:hypothetical protein
MTKTENKSLYTPKEEKLIEYLLTLEFTDKVQRILKALQQRQVNREVRIIENRPNKNDIANGYTQKEFPWLAKFNY